MPVFEIRALKQKSGFDPVPVMKRLCSRVAQVMKVDPSHVWATWEEIKPGWYVEGKVGGARSASRSGEIFVGGEVRVK